MTRLSDIGEDALIQRLIRLVPLDPAPAAGPGDDCAVIDPGSGHPDLLLLKTDALVEHVHFLPDAPARALGWKSCARVVSDFAAMGGRCQRLICVDEFQRCTGIVSLSDVFAYLSRPGPVTLRRDDGCLVTAGGGHDEGKMDSAGGGFT